MRVPLQSTRETAHVTCLERNDLARSELEFDPVLLWQGSLPSAAFSRLLARCSFNAQYC